MKDEGKIVESGDTKSQGSVEDDYLSEDYEAVDTFNEDEREEMQMTEQSAEERVRALAGQLQLQYEWVFWYDEKSTEKGMSERAYESNTKKLGKFSTVQDFWRYWNNLDCTRFPDGTNLRVFKGGIKPMWEDPANKNGGKWMLRTKKELTHEVWSKLVLALIGEQFFHSESLCGVVLAVRPQGNAINMWNRNGDNEEEILTTTAQLKTITGFDFVYQLHSSTVLWKSSGKVNPALLPSSTPPIPLRRTLEKKTSLRESGSSPSLPMARKESTPPPAAVSLSRQSSEPFISRTVGEGGSRIKIDLPEFVKQRWGDLDMDMEHPTEIPEPKIRTNWADVRIPPRSALSELLDEEDAKKRELQENKEKRKRKPLRKTISVSVLSKESISAPSSPSGKRGDGRGLALSSSLDLGKGLNRTKEEDKKKGTNKKPGIRRSILTSIEEMELKQSPKMGSSKKEDWRKSKIEISMDEEQRGGANHRLRSSLGSGAFEDGEERMKSKEEENGEEGARRKRRERGKPKARKEKKFQFDVLHGILMLVVVLLLAYMFTTLPLPQFMNK